MSVAEIPDETSEEGIPIAPSVERWREMSRADRDAFLDRALAALQHQAELMPEGSPHIRSKFGIREILGEYYARIGRKIYLGTELPTHYPGEAVFAPDFLAVLDVEDPGDDDWRMAWVVADEGKGLDFVMEVLHAGDRRKDLVDNVLDYARMGIPEYFVYDRKKLRIHGFRLPSPTSTRYEPIPPRGGVYTSRVLGLDLAMVNGHLRFLHAGAVVPGTQELLARANAIVDELEQRAEEEAKRADAELKARQSAEQRAEALARRVEEEAERATAEAERADAESRRADAEAAARAAAEQRIAELLARLGES